MLEFSLYAARHPQARRRLVEQQRRERETLVPLIEAELARGGAEPPMPSDVLASIFLAFFNGIALQHVIDPDDADDTLVQAAIEFLGSGVDSFPKRHDAS
jgi:hypothetical protein